MTRLYLWGGVALVSAFCSWWLTSDHYQGRIAAMRLAESQAIVSAMEAARTAEREQQQEVNNAIQHQNRELVAIRNRLAADLERLQREASGSERDLRENAAADGSGRPWRTITAEGGAIILEGAARHDELREALRTCYEYADRCEKLNSNK